MGPIHAPLYSPSSSPSLGVGSCCPAGPTLWQGGRGDMGWEQAGLWDQQVSEGTVLGWKREICGQNHRPKLLLAPFPSRFIMSSWLLVASRFAVLPPKKKGANDVGHWQCQCAGRAHCEGTCALNQALCLHICPCDCILKLHFISWTHRERERISRILRKHLWLEGLLSPSWGLVTKPATSTSLSVSHVAVGMCKC